MKAAEMWGHYLRVSGKEPHTSYEAWHFCNNAADANELAALTLQGTKRATASLYELYELEQAPVPKIGDLSVIVEWEEEAVCIIETQRVEILPFKDISAEHARIEGEGDGSLAYWRRAHQLFFGEEAKSMGIRFSEESLVVFETFKVVYPA